jgi:hypothetical protein
MALVYAGRSSAVYAPGGQTAQDGYGGGELAQAGRRPQRSRDAQRMAREAG